MDSEDDSDIFITPSTFRSPEDLDMDFPNFNIETLFLLPELVSEPNELAQSSSTEVRFGEPLSQEEVKEKIVKSVPKNTTYKDNWAINLFKQWRQERKLELVQA